MEFSTAIGEFLADLTFAGRSERTRHGHELELLRLSTWCAGAGLAWHDLDRRQLQRYTRLRADKGFSSRSNMLCSLRTFYRWAVEQGYVALSPAAGFKTPIRPEPLPRALTRDQIRRLLDHLAGGAGPRARRDEALILTGLYAGLRAGELAGLRWPAVDLAGGAVNIRLSKMGKGRSVKLHPDLATHLTIWRAIQAGGDGAPVFSLDGDPIVPNRVGKICARIRRATGLPLTAHALRHSFATWGLRECGDVYSVSKALGHSALKQTEYYLAGDLALSSRAIDALPGIGEW